MTDRLSEIDGRLVQGHWDEDWAKDDVEWLIAEVKRLREALSQSHPAHARGWATCEWCDMLGRSES